MAESSQVKTIARDKSEESERLRSVVLPSRALGAAHAPSQNMRGSVPPEQLEAVVEAVRKFPDGATVRDIVAALPAHPPERTVRNWLDDLIKQQRISQVGAAWATRYCATLTPPAPPLPANAPAAGPVSRRSWPKVSAVGSAAVPVSSPPELRVPSPSLGLPSPAPSPVAQPPPPAVSSGAGLQAVRPPGPPRSVARGGWQWKNEPAYNAAPGENPFDYMLRQIDEFGRGPSRAADYVQAEARLYIAPEQQGAFLAAMKSELARKFAHW